MRQHRPRSAGFTLVEILIVVTILGILAAVVTPLFATATSAARQSAFASDINTWSKAATLYIGMTGEYLEDASTGEVPSGWESYIDTGKWTRGAPINGRWDVELNSFSVTQAVGVHFQNGSGEAQDDAFMAEIDAMLDDGALATGGFRKLASDRYYSVIVD